MSKIIYKSSIKKWLKEERPRERLFKYGEHTLSNAELLAIIFGSGTKGLNAIELGREILDYFKTLRNMSHTDLQEMRSFKGMGDAKIARLKACFELGRRFMIEQRKSGEIVRNPEDVARIFMPRLRDLKKEVFQILLLDGKNQIIDIIEIDEGSVDTASPYIREIILKALQKFAVSLIVTHNHPSGNPQPSREDIIFTKRLKIACDVMQLSILDHIIIGDNRYYSFNKEKRL